MSTLLGLRSQYRTPREWQYDNPVMRSSPNRRSMPVSGLESCLMTERKSPPVQYSRMSHMLLRVSYQS